MIVKDIYVNENGKILYINYSDLEVKIQDIETKIIYDCAIDPENFQRNYIETNVPITQEEVE